MLARNASLVCIGVLILTLGFNGAVVAPAHASDTGRILAGLAVGALVYSALDDDGCSTSRHHRGPRAYQPPAHQRYNPPSRYSGYGYWERPKDTYDRGYGDGWNDGYGYGKHQGQRQGYRRGYKHGYGDGRHDQRVADRIGPPYHRGGRYAEKSYGGRW